MKPSIGLTALSVAILAGCAGPQPPAAPAPVVATPVSAPFAKTWDAVIDVFAQRNIPIKTIERASGFIATDQLGVPVLIGGAAHPWADCGKAMIGGFFPPTNATYNVRVKEAGGGSTVQITVLWGHSSKGMPMAGPDRECSTKGVWEREAVTEIRRLAEG